MKPVKITRFRDIPPFVRNGNYEIDVPVMEVDRWIETQVAEANLDIDPDFQRGHVWSDEQRVQWLQHLLRGGRNGRVIYLNHPGWQDDCDGDFVLVDGKQRVSAIAAFKQNKIRVFGSYFREYTDKCSMLQTLKINVNTLKTRALVLQWYLQMNAGGTPHTQHELDRVMGLLQSELRREAK